MNKKIVDQIQSTIIASIIIRTLLYFDKKYKL